jgi:hypothetical protein
MIVYSLVISFFLTVIAPIFLTVIFPEISFGKGVESIGPFSVIYILSLFSLLSILFYSRKNYEDRQLKYYRASLLSAQNVTLGIIFLLALYIGRTLYYFYVHSSPYALLVQEGSMVSDVFSRQVINYYFVLLNFKLYPLIQGLIIITLPKKYWPFFFFFEAAYSILIYSKFILFTTILLMIIVYLPKRIKLFHFLFISVIFILLFLIFRDVFGQLRIGGSFSIINFEIKKLIIDGISRIQAFFPILYAEHILDNWMYGKSLCKVVGLIIPDSLIELPIQCQNIDEHKIIQYFGMSNVRLINKDLLNFWSEPFANFSFLGFLLIGFTVLLIERFIIILGSGPISGVFSWVVLINTLMAHVSWSAYLGHICMSFVILWIISKINLN